MSEKVSQRNIGLYPDDLIEIEALVNAYHISSSAAVRMIIAFWREHRDPGSNSQQAKLRALAESYLREQIAAKEFADEATLEILSG